MQGSHSLFFVRLFQLGIRIIIKKKKNREQGDSRMATHTLITFGQSLQLQDRERKTNLHISVYEKKKRIFCSNKKKTLESKSEKKRRGEPFFGVDYLYRAGMQAYTHLKRKKKDEENVMHNL